MDLPNIIAVILIAAAVGGAIAYIVISKKRGSRCIGCPEGGNCQSCAAYGCKACAGQQKEGEEN